MQKLRNEIRPLPWLFVHIFQIPILKKSLAEGSKNPSLDGAKTLAGKVS